MNAEFYQKKRHGNERLHFWPVPATEDFEAFEPQGMPCGCIVMRPRGTPLVESCPAHDAIESVGSNHLPKE